MNSERQGYVITSVIYRILQKRPEEKLDAGVTIWTHVYANSEYEAKTMAEDQVRRDFVVDEYKFVRIEKSESWMAERLAESADSMLMQELPFV